MVEREIEAVFKLAFVIFPGHTRPHILELCDVSTPCPGAGALWGQALAALGYTDTSTTRILVYFLSKCWGH